MKYFTKDWVKYNLPVFIIVLILFFFIGYSIDTDFDLHSKHLVDINNHEKGYPVNFVYHLFINFISGFSEEYIVIFPLTLLFVAFLTFWKYYLTNKYLSTVVKNNTSYIISFLCLFYFAIPDPYGITEETIYLGRFVPSVFHNTTLILVMPFVMLLFFKQIEIIKKNFDVTYKDWSYLFILIVINTYCKPSYLFAFIPVSLFFLMYSYKERPIWKTIKKMTVYILGVLLIIGSTFLVYKIQFGSFQNEKSSILISLFQHHRAYYPFWNFPIVLFLSFLFPIGFLWFNWRSIKNNIELKFSLLSLIFGMGMGFLISEVGPRKGHGNFLWQIIACYYLVLIVMVKVCVEKFKSNKMSKLEKRTLSVLFGLHILSGINYIMSLFYWGHI